MNDSTEGTALVRQWRENPDIDNPAGPLFIGGQFAQSDIVSATQAMTTTYPCTLGTRVNDNCCR